MKNTTLSLLLTAGLTASVAQCQSLLTDGDFNTVGSAAWTTWTYGGGYANLEVITPAASVQGDYDGSLQMTCGAANTSGGGGVYQIVPATAGLDYTLTADAGAQNWWLPTGQIRLFFFDAGNNQLNLTQIDTTDSLHNGSNGGAGDEYDTGVPYQNWSLSAVAPAGTTQVKVEFAGYGGGSAWFDNAVLTAQPVPEPSFPALLAVGFGSLLACRRWRSA